MGGDWVGGVGIVKDGWIEIFGVASDGQVGGAIREPTKLLCQCVMGVTVLG